MRCLLVLWWSLLVCCRGALSQGVQVGSAAASFGTGVVFARDADAVFWNSALLGLQPFQDVRSDPVGGLRVLSVAVSAGASRRWLDEAARFGLLGRGLRAAAPWWARLIGPGVGGADGTDVDVVWLSTASGSLGVAISSHAVAAADVVDRVAGDSVYRAATTLLSVGLVGGAGRIAGIPVRAGVTLKGRWVHMIAAGAWMDPASSGSALREIEVRGIPGGSLDIGSVLQPGMWSASAGLTGKAPLRMAVTGGSGSFGLQVGWIAKSCRMPWSAPVGRWRRDAGSRSALAFSLSYGVRSPHACAEPF